LKISGIAQQNLFVWDEIENLGDLERLKLVIEFMPDEVLMNTLEAERGKGRNDYPVRAMWNSVLAGVVFEHERVETLRRELGRNSQLRLLCGFHSTQRKNLGSETAGVSASSSCVYTIFKIPDKAFGVDR